MKMNWNDSLNLISKLTWSKLWNVIKVLSSYYYSTITRQHIQWGKPISISIEPTTSCNLRCPECPSGLRSFTRNTGMLDQDFFRRMITEMKDSLAYLIFYFQGEPYLNPKFLEMVRYASEQRIYTATSTNAHYLTDEIARKTIESGLDRLIISIDGITQEVYEQYRVGGNLDKVIEGTRNVVKWKRKLKSKTPHIIFQFLVVRPNENQIPEIIKMGKEIGVDDVWLKTAQVYEYKNGNELIPLNERYSRYRKQPDGTYTLKNQLLNHCWKLWHSSVITWDGVVVPCCFDKDASHRFGDLKKNSFQEIWQNEKYKNFRKNLLKSRKEIDICTNCSEGTRVWS
jgi:radical SAM protein with 4Fe4S-binding SPASM domain